jgi:WD40-like Beta Propeller Repeat
MKSTSQLQAPMLSPDGRWLAYSSNETNRFEVYVRAHPGPGAKYQVSSDGGTEPRWARSGREPFFRSEDNMMAVSVAEKESALQIGAPVKLFNGGFATVGGSNLDTYYDVSPDGRRFLMVKADENAGAGGIVVIQNFTTELKARVATK